MKLDELLNDLKEELGFNLGRQSTEYVTEWLQAKLTASFQELEAAFLRLNGEAHVKDKEIAALHEEARAYCFQLEQLQREGRERLQVTENSVHVADQMIRDLQRDHAHERSKRQQAETTIRYLAGLLAKESQ